MAPIKIPELHIQQGLPVEVVKHNLEEGYPAETGHVPGIRELCGHNELCVHVVIEHRYDDPTFDRCQFVATDPPEGTPVRRDGNVVLVTGTKPCSTSPSPDASEQSPGGDPVPPDSGAPSAGGPLQVPPAIP